MGRQLSLLTLPLEVRILIYEVVLEPDDFDFVDPTYMLADQRHSLMCRLEGFNVVAIGSAPHRERVDLQSLARRQHDPWILARICRQVRHETARKLAAISLDDVFFSFYGFTPGDMSAWVERVGPQAVSKIRRWGIDSVNWCHDWYRWAERNPRDWELAPSCLRLHRAPHREQMQCYRAVSVDLATMNAEFKEPDTLVPPHSRTSDVHTGIHCDHRIGVRDEGAHLHRELVGVQCNLELLQGCLDAEEQLMVKNEGSSAGGDTPMATIGGLTTLVMAVRGREQYDDERLLSRFPRRGSCDRVREI